MLDGIFLQPLHSMLLHYNVSPVISLPSSQCHTPQDVKCEATISAVRAAEQVGAAGSAMTLNRGWKFTVALKRSFWTAVLLYSALPTLTRPRLMHVLPLSASCCPSGHTAQHSAPQTSHSMHCKDSQRHHYHRPMTLQARPLRCLRSALMLSESCCTCGMLVGPARRLIPDFH